MDFLTGKIRPMYVKYLSAAFGSALISSIYGVVDMAMVGQYQGPDGTAALAVVAPIWNIIYSLGLLMGIGGSVLLSTLRGVSEKNQRQSNEYFAAALIGASFLAALSWLGVVFLDRELLTLFGAEETLLPLARQYLLPVKVVVPSFLFTQFLSAFLRNDGNPGLATKAVLFGGVFNVLGDYFFVFTLDMGIMGAGLATAMGSVFSLLMMLTHFRKKQNTLRWEWPTRLLSKLKAIGITGFSTFFIDVAMGILTVLFNRQILKYLDTNALSVFGAEKGGRIATNATTFNRELLIVEKESDGKPFALHTDPEDKIQYYKSLRNPWFTIFALLALLALLDKSLWLGLCALLPLIPVLLYQRQIWRIKRENV